MARRRRTGINGGLVLAAGAVTGVLWAWSQPWGPAVIVGALALAVAAGIVRVSTAVRRRRRHRYEVATLQGLLDLTPRQFEEEVADLLHWMGFTSVIVSAGAGDLQADIVATDPDGLTTIVQCKRYAPDRRIGSPVIQSFIGMARIHHEGDRALFITTGSFTAPACRLADEHDIELVDGTDLVALFTDRAEAGAAR